LVTIFATASIAAVTSATMPVSVAASAADEATSDFGRQAVLVNGSVVQGWTVDHLKKSSDTIAYPVQGTLWEATATDEALQGGVIPIIANLNARSSSGENYRVLFQVATPQGVNPAVLSQGQKTTGKVYFDVTGDDPDKVVYDAGGDDLAQWATPNPPVVPNASAQQPHNASPPDRSPIARTDTATDIGSPAGQNTTSWAGTPQPPAAAPPTTPGWVGTAQPTASAAPATPGWVGTAQPAASTAPTAPLTPGNSGTQASAASDSAAGGAPATVIAPAASSPVTP